MARSAEATRQAKAEYMRLQRSTPEGRNRLNVLRRKSYANGGTERQRGRLHRKREQHFFRWRAGLWVMRFGVKVTAEELASLWHQQRGRCALSGRKLGRDAHLDHSLPVSKGGAHTLDNLRWLDPQVNRARREMSDDELADLCGNVITWLGERIRRTP